MIAECRTVTWIRRVIAAVFCILDDILVGAANIFDRGKFGRKLMLLVSLYLTVASYYKGFQFLEAAQYKFSLELAACLAAVLAPLSFLQKAIFETYKDSTQSPVNDAPSPPTAAVGAES